MVVSRKKHDHYKGSMIEYFGTPREERTYKKTTVRGAGIDVFRENSKAAIGKQWEKKRIKGKYQSVHGPGSLKHLKLRFDLLKEGDIVSHSEKGNGVITRKCKNSFYAIFQGEDEPAQFTKDDFIYGTLDFVTLKEDSNGNWLI